METAAQQNALSDARAQFIGTWQLLDQYTHFADGTRTPSRGDAPRGILTYDAAGNMAVQLMRTDAQAAHYTDMTDLETAMSGYIGYFGTYTIDPTHQLIYHEVTGSSYVDYRGSRQTRSFQFSDAGNTLTLSAVADDGSQRILRWQRVA